MILTVARLSAGLLLTAQFLPIGLPVLCDQVRDEAPLSCEQQMAPADRAALDVERASPLCLNTALCPTHVTAVPVLGAAALMLAGESDLGRVASERFAPADPRAPLPPPPEA